jgi:hypothetical protein
VAEQGHDGATPDPGWAPPDTTTAPVGGPSTPMPPIGPPPSTWQQPSWDPAPPRRRRAWPWVLGSIGLLGTLAVAVAMLTSDDGEDDRGGRAVPTGGGRIFEDVQGEYTIEVDQDWRRAEDLGDIEVFRVRDPDRSPDTVVTLVTAPDAANAGEETYVRGGLAYIERLVPGAVILDSGVTEGSDGTERGFIESTAPSPAGDLHILAIVDVVGERAVIANFTTPEEHFDRLRSRVEPFLLTVRASER